MNSVVASTAAEDSYVGPSRVPSLRTLARYHKRIGTVRSGSVSDLYSFDTDPDPAFQAKYGTDPDPIQIQSFDDQKQKKILSWIFFLKSKTAIFSYPWASIKGIQVTEKAFSPQNRTSSTSKQMKFLNFFSTFVGYFCPPGCGLGNGSADLIESGSGFETLYIGLPYLPTREMKYVTLFLLPCQVRQHCP